jgi:pyruvate carboxylase subunit B
MIHYVTIGLASGGEHTFMVRLGPDGVEIDGEAVQAELARVAGTDVHSLLMDGASHRLVARRMGGGRWELHAAGQRLQAEVLDERARAIREIAGVALGPTGPRPVRAPMPGLVVRVEVSLGDVITAGQGVAIVEAMKMENELTADGEGRVSAILVAEGDTVERDQVLVELTSLKEDASLTQKASPEPRNA